MRCHDSHCDVAVMCYPEWINGAITYFLNTCILTCPLLLSFLLLFFLPDHCFFFFLSLHSYRYPNELLPFFLFLFSPLVHCYFLSCYFFSYLSTVTFFPVTFFPVTFFPTWNCYFLSCYFFSYLSTVTFFPVTFFPVTFFPTWNCYFLSCYLFSCYFLSVHHRLHG